MTGGPSGGYLSQDGDIVLKGATDDTLIGNEGDRLKVTSSLSPTPQTNVIYKTVRLLNSSSESLAVNGSVTPVNFDFSPGSGETWYLESIQVWINDNGVNSPDKFGARSALTNGLLFQVTSKGTLYTLDTVKDNIHLALTFKEHHFVPVTSGLFETSDIFEGQWIFRTPIVLQNSTSDFVRAKVQDNLTGLDFARVAVRLWRTI